MRRSGRVPWTEVRIGTVILFAFAVLLWAAFQGTGMTVLKKTYPLRAYFDDVNGLVSGAPVWLGGIEVGHISRIEFLVVDGIGRIQVGFEIREHAWEMVSSESRVSIVSMGLMGDKYMSITSRKPGQPPVARGSFIEAAPPSDLTSVFADTPDLISGLTRASERLATVMERIERGEGFLGRLTYDSRSSAQIDSLVESTRQLMTDLNGSQRRLVASVERAAASFDSLAHGVLHGNGTLARLVWDSTLYTELTGVATRANRLIERWDSGGGTMGRLATDSSMYIEIRGLVADMRYMIDDITENPRKYFKFSVF